MTQDLNLYQALGGKDALQGVVDDFYLRVLADTTLAPFFAGLDMAQQRKHLVAFLGMAFGGPDSYQGRDLSKAHAHLNLQETHFTAVAKHLLETLKSLEVPQTYIDSLLGAVASLKDKIVSSP